MGYFRTGLDLAHDMLSTEPRVSYVEACRFARDTFHGATALAVIGAAVSEVFVGSPGGSLLSLSLLGIGGATETGARINNNIISEG